jgi:hypothetical protein
VTAPVDERITAALHFQREALGHASLSSPLYRALLDAMIADTAAGGPCAVVLAATPPEVRPIPDALALRFLGAVHRLVLAGAAPALARWFPTAGGAFEAGAGDPGPDLVAAVAAHQPELMAGLALGVQTNEVARCAPLAIGFTELLRRFALPLGLREIGSSAGLNLRWDRWRYESGDTAWGHQDAPLVFADNYRAPLPDLSAPIGPGDAVASRRGSDRSPIDTTTEAGRRLLTSFVWPDQPARHERLAAGLEAAAATPAPIDQQDAGDWCEQQLADPVEGVTTVLFHSIVWQYLSRDTRARVTAAVEAAGARASTSAPVAWLRMEPGDDPNAAAELRLRTWPGEPNLELLALSGYHGHPVWMA